MDIKAVRPYIRRIFISLNYPLAGSLKLLRKTLKFEENFWNQLEENRPAIIALYHGELLPLVLYGAFREKLATVVSKHSDGEIIARVLQRLGYYTVRGSTDSGRSKGGKEALLELKRLLEKGYHIAVTVDGPKGPCCEVKEGILFLSWFLKRPIYPVRVEVKGFRLPTWDKFLVPLPFSELRIKLGEPIVVKTKDFKLYKEIVEKKLKELKGNI